MTTQSATITVSIPHDYAVRLGASLDRRGRERNVS